MFAPPAQAFIFIRGGIYSAGERPVLNAPVWRGRTIRFHVNTNLDAYNGSASTAVGDIGFTGQDLLTTVEQAVNAWLVSCRSDLRVELAGTTTALSDPDDQKNVIIVDNRKPADFADPCTDDDFNFRPSTCSNNNSYSTTLAFSRSLITSNDEFFDCDILVNGNLDPDNPFAVGSSIPTGNVDLRSVLTHEIGHCLGLDHPVQKQLSGDYYNSTNPFLLSSTMVQTRDLDAADQESDTSRRDINKDDRHAIECLYERGSAVRRGKRCSSYHGTNGNGGLQDLVDPDGIPGGPTGTEIDEDGICGSPGDARTVSPSLAIDSSGCIQGAIASESGSHPLSPRSGPWFWIALLIAARLGQVAWRRRKFPVLLIAAAILASLSQVPQSHAAGNMTFSSGTQSFQSDLWDRFVGMDQETAVWDSGPSSQKQGSSIPLVLEYEFKKKRRRSFLARLQYTLPRTLTATGTPQGESAITKTSKLSGFRLAPVFRYFLDRRETFFLETGISMGMTSLSQTVSGGLNGTLNARAIELGTHLSAGIQAFPRSRIHPFFRVGYGLSRTGYFLAGKTSGTAYGDFTAGDRLAVRSGSATEDLRISTSGFHILAGVTFPLEGRESNTRVGPKKASFKPAPSIAPQIEEAPEAEPTTFPAEESEPASKPDLDLGSSLF